MKLTIYVSAPGAGLRATSQNVQISGSSVPILSPSHIAVTAEIYPPAGICVLDGSTRTSIRFAKSSTLFVIGPAESQKPVMGTIPACEIIGIVGFIV